jgi:hypothetical protein
MINKGGFMTDKNNDDDEFDIMELVNLSEKFMKKSALDSMAPKGLTIGEAVGVLLSLPQDYILAQTDPKDARNNKLFVGFELNDDLGLVSPSFNQRKSVGSKFKDTGFHAILKEKSIEALDRMIESTNKSIEELEKAIQNRKNMIEQAEKMKVDDFNSDGSVKVVATSSGENDDDNVIEDSPTTNKFMNVFLVK